MHVLRISFYRAWLSVEAKLRRLFTACITQGCFPNAWREGQLVLIRKQGRPEHSPSAYRPIVLLNEVGKLLERVVAARIVEHLDSVGSPLSNKQFGFRRGRSTIDALTYLRSRAERAVARGQVVLVVSLDIINAFNTLPWECIVEALRFHRIPLYLRRIVKSYLTNRSVSFLGQNGWQQHSITCGVPQGSVLGPLLWNIGYDWVLRDNRLDKVKLVYYADDTLIMAQGCDFGAAAALATEGVNRIVGKIRTLGLEVALNKSKAICFHGPRKGPVRGVNIVVDGVPIGVEATMRYLGLILDSRWSFIEHFRKLVPRLVSAAGALERLLPRIGGSYAGCRKLYAGVIRSMALYGAPIWAGD